MLPGRSDTEAAKARLREVKPELDLVSWVTKQPFTALLIAAGAGGLAARLPCRRLLSCLDLLLKLLPDGGQRR